MGRPKKNFTSSYTPKKVSGLEGMQDIVTEVDGLWDILLKRLYKTNRIYGFSPLETPLLEDWQLYENFNRTSPQDSQEIVKIDTGERPVGLRKSILPSVLRSYYEHKTYEKLPLSKWSYGGLVVNSSQNLKQLSSHYEFGYEVFGNFTHLTEAQVISAVWELLSGLGLTDAVLEINHLGQDTCQSAYQEILQDFLATKKFELCDNCNEHIKGRVLNVFRCSNIDCQAVLSEAPAVLDFLEQESHKHFTSILEALDELGIPYQLNPLYVGPDGHSRTNVVIKYKHKGEMKVLGEGGYHENLMQNLCGKNYCCFGFTGNLSNIYEILSASKVTVTKELKNDVFLVPLGELASKRSLRLFRDLTTQKISVYDHFGTAGVKNQLKQAETYKAPIALIIGQKEAMEEMVILRDVKSGMQEIISYDKIVEEVKKRLGR
jgi:histidyl-tRNA synthetase